MRGSRGAFLADFVSALFLTIVFVRAIVLLQYLARQRLFIPLKTTNVHFRTMLRHNNKTK